MIQPVIRVGILERRPEVQGYFNTEYEISGGRRFQGDFEARREGNSISLVSGDEIIMRQLPEILCRTENPGTFELRNVAIGVQFHWERRENQVFQGNLQLLRDHKGVTAINEIGVEEYLKSVISSEMSAESPMELLKAHAITSRSWLVAMLRRQARGKSLGKAEHGHVSEKEIIRWYDREDHELFDVCADDHCQRYQGVTKIISDAAARAVDSTRGLFLISEGEICDARFSKACGGRTDGFENAWEDRRIPYLRSISDGSEEFLWVRSEEDAEKWIMDSPPAYCRTVDETVLKQILPSFDQETADFFRWKVEYKSEDLARIVRRKSGIDFGTIRELVPITRSPSGRILRLKIVGSKRTMIVGKELEIRRWLSPSHLYSSAFIVRRELARGGAAKRFILYGAGWGHGVGLCQIGAAVMAMNGKKAEEILKHYFRDTELKKLY